MNDTTTKPSRTLLIAAFGAIYIVWGSTYLAIRVAVETLPPFLSAGARFFFAGTVLLLVLRAKGTAAPTREQWRTASVTGVLLLLGGNGLVVWAEQWVASGFTALLVAMAPVWFALLEWLRPQGTRPDAKTILGIVIGFIGVAMLVNTQGTSQGHTYLAGVIAILVAGISWAAGSLYSKYHRAGGSPWMNSAAQMICGGLALLITGALVGEPVRTEWSRISGRSLAALAYLVVFGSWIAFSAYIWLLKASTPARVSTYAYANPMIAVLLGWAILGEKISARMFWGAMVIVIGVVTITLPRSALANVFGTSGNTSARAG
jgi:drug/metabolite transporter (DMT)-like permease